MPWSSIDINYKQKNTFTSNKYSLIAHILCTHFFMREVESNHHRIQH